MLQIDTRKIGEIGVDGIYVFTLQIVSQDLLMPQYNLSGGYTIVHTILIQSNKLRLHCSCVITAGLKI